MAKILIIDDEEKLRSLLARIVKSEGFEVFEAKDLKSIKAVTTRAFDLLSAQGNYQKFSLCDHIIEPKELANFSTFETNKAKMQTIFDIGYRESKNTLQEINA